MKKERNEVDFGVKFIDKLLKILNWKVSLEQEHLLVQIFKFVIVGIVATIIDFVFLYIFREFCNLEVLVANTLSFSISVIYNYWASLTFVFDVNQEKSKKKSFVIFIICSIIGLLINDFVVFVVTKMFKVYYLFSKVIATVIVMIFNFVTRKKFLE